MNAFAVVSSGRAAHLTGRRNGPASRSQVRRGCRAVNRDGEDGRRPAAEGRSRSPTRGGGSILPGRFWRPLGRVTLRLRLQRSGAELSDRRTQGLNALVFRRVRQSHHQPARGARRQRKIDHVGYQPRSSRNEWVSPGLGGSAWPADGAVRATTSAPLLSNSGDSREQSLGLWPSDARAALVVLGLQSVSTMERARAGRVHGTAVVVVARQKVAIGKWVTRVSVQRAQWRRPPAWRPA